MSNNSSGKNIRIESKPNPMNHQNLEIIERKGIGHPDSIADGISESISRALCQEYRDKFGGIAHHNTDEVQIIAGKSSPGFKESKINKPIYILLGGRATRKYDGTEIDVDKIALREAKNYIKSTIRNLKDYQFNLRSKIGTGSSDLTDIYMRENKVPLANDTSFGIGHAPLSNTERLVLELEHHLNSDEFKKKYPSVGEDIKVMALREDNQVRLTVAIAFVGKYIDDIDAYISIKNDIKQEIEDFASRETDRPVDVYLNTADPKDPSPEDVYLTVTGTSAEMGDDGSTGRGNRVNGLITPRRPMSLEAASGKNPLAHVGKIYNILAHYIGDQIYESVDKVQGAHIKLLSEIGTEINKPKVAYIRVSTEDGLGKSVNNQIKEEVSYWLENIPKVMDEVIEGNIKTY